MVLEKPLTIQLAVQGSRSKVNFGENYDLILGTPFLYQHKAMVGLHSPRVVIGSSVHDLAKPLCSQAGATALPPLATIQVSGGSQPGIPAQCY